MSILHMYEFSFAPLPKKPLAPALILGYYTWNAFRGDINEDKVKRTADLMVEKGLVDAGYEYLIIDDGYLLKERDSEGKIIIDSAKFPSGMKALSDYVHSKGLKFGMYNCAGTYTCMGLAGSFGHEHTDAEIFADFDVDFLKYDFCYNPLDGSFYAPDLFSITLDGIKYTGAHASLVGSARLGDEDQVEYIGNNDGEAEFLVEVFKDAIYELEIEYATGNEYRALIFQVNNDDPQIVLGNQTGGFDSNDTKVFKTLVGLKKGVSSIRFYMDLDNAGLDLYSYQRMGDELLMSGHDIVFAVCEWGTHQPFKWAEEVGHMWRTSGDITYDSGACNFTQIVANYDTTLALFQYAGENAYNDPDMLCIGLSGINHDENIAHISLWAITASPLLIGADLETIAEEYANMLKNSDMLAINEDQLYKQGLPIYHFDEFDVLLKEMIDNRVAICFFNRLGDRSQDISLDLSIVSEFLDEQSAWKDATAYLGTEIWTKVEIRETSEDPLLKMTVPPHGAGLFIIVPE